MACKHLEQKLCLQWKLVYLVVKPGQVYLLFFLNEPVGSTKNLVWHAMAQTQNQAQTQGLWGFFSSKPMSEPSRTQAWGQWSSLTRHAQAWDSTHPSLSLWQGHNLCPYLVFGCVLNVSLLYNSHLFLVPALISI